MIGPLGMGGDVTAGALTVGRPKKDAKKKSGPKTVGIRVSGEYAEWLTRLMKHCRMDIAKMTDRAWAELARKEGFDEPPPERVP